MPTSRPLNPTVLFVVVVALWVVIDRVVPGSWIVTLLVTAVAVNALLWVHVRWRRRRAGRALDPSRPYSREQ